MHKSEINRSSHINQDINTTNQHISILIMETAQEYITGVLISFVRKMFLDRNYSIVFTFNEKTKMYSNRIEMQLFYTRDDDEEAELFMILSYDKTHGIIKKFSMEKNFDKLFIEKHGEGNYNYLLKNIQYSHLPLKLDF